MLSDCRRWEMRGAERSDDGSGSKRGDRVLGRRPSNRGQDVQFLVTGTHENNSKINTGCAEFCIVYDVNIKVIMTNNNYSD